MNRHAHNIPCIAEGKINAGMPYLEEDVSGAVSSYEFLPSWFFYTPVVLQSLLLAVRYGDVRLPLVVNPTIFLSGMVGESKHDILSLAGPIAAPWISPFISMIKTTDSVGQQEVQAQNSLAEASLSFPIVAKPDLGCRGVGVKLLKNTQQLKEYIASYPDNARFLLQEKAPYEAEAGVFYVRHPNESKGKIISITLKYTPSVVGDGVKTLKELIEQNPRAGQLSHLYLPRHQNKLDWVIPTGQEFQLAFAGSHSRGSIFRDGNQYISEALTQKLDTILADVDGYYYGRLDIKFRDINSFMAGEHFTILELNGASSEAAHIWDRKTPLKDIYKTLLAQYRILFEIGAAQKKRGYKPPSLKTLIGAWKEEKALMKQYPMTD
ncbi:ATP-grasp domain-containing protein [Marinomonas pollencensis]|uniref:ATP-grasp domain-containing protein n=1 Tax=Marinomonas pollencensis TaxID=491954 RepID=A0A3E0DA39_9GAMM|nr:ATP-grasp domain-containing protein [Marinomonas pollencensis]REG79434.1 ATP-grasp domain-containing protein [Marinomonas pollencensis]